MGRSGELCGLGLIIKKALELDVSIETFMPERYYVFKVEDESDCRCQHAIPDDAFLESSEEADEYLANGDGAERGYSSYEEVEINEAHDFIGYFFDTVWRSTRG